METMKQPRVEHHDDVEMMVIDLLKIKGAPQKQELLRLLSVVNDLDSGSYLSALLTEHEKSLGNQIRDSWNDGVVLYLLKQRFGIVYVALYDVLKTMKDKVECVRPQKRSPTTPRSLWLTIIDNQELDDGLTKLVKYLDDPAKNQLAQNETLSLVRNKIAFHADPGAFSHGLDKLIEKHEQEAQERKEQPEPLGLVVCTDSPQRLRFLFVDQIVSSYWESKALEGSSPKDQQERLNEIQKYRDRLSEIRGKTADWVLLLFHTYCDEYGIKATDSQHESVKRELQAELKNRSKN